MNETDSELLSVNLYEKWCSVSDFNTVAVRCFLTTDFNVGTIRVSLNYTLQISHKKSTLHSRTFN
jgi:hypothetical protein